MINHKRTEVSYWNIRNALDTLRDKVQREDIEDSTKSAILSEVTRIRDMTTAMYPELLVLAEQLQVAANLSKMLWR